MSGWCHQGFHSSCQHIWKTQQWPQYWKRSILIPIPKKKSEKMKSLSCVWLFVTPWTIDYQSPPSMGFSRQEYWSGWPFSPPIPKKGSTKEDVIHHTTAPISHVSKVMLKILHAGFQHMWTKNFQMSKLGLEKEEELKVKLPTFVGV